MTQARCRQALETALQTWATANGHTVAWQNVTTSPEPAAYLRAYLLPNDTESADIGRANRRYSGTFQISICRPLGEGAGPGQAIATALAALFNPAAPLTAGGLTVWIAQPLSEGAAITEPAHSVLPCSVQYLADTY